MKDSIFMNSYLRAPYGYYRYASMDDFMTGEKPMLYGITYGYNGKTLRELN